jgi:ribosome maturation factor RimP
MADRSDALVRVLEPVVAALGLDLYDVELAGMAHSRTLRVLVDRPIGDDQGVDLEAITAATQAVSPVLDTDPTATSLLRGSYTLEVSSPGLERPLRTPAHYRRAIGSTVSVKSRGADGPRRLRGVLAAADDTGLDLDTDDGRTHVGYDDVVQARTVFEWGPSSKSSSSKQTTKSRGPRSGRAKEKTQA